MYEQAHCHDEAANHQLPFAVAFWIIRIVSIKECSSLMQKSDADSLPYLPSHFECDIATQYTCSLDSVYCPHWRAQWSHHCSCMCIAVHSPWLPGYINVAQAILIILTMTRHFSDRPYVVWDEGKLEHLCVVSGNIKWCSHYEKKLWWFLKLSYDLTIPLVGIHPTELKAETNVCTLMFIVAIIHNSQKVEATQFISKSKWIKRMWYMHTMAIIKL